MRRTMLFGLLIAAVCLTACTVYLDGQCEDDVECPVGQACLLGGCVLNRDGSAEASGELDAAGQTDTVDAAVERDAADAARETAVDAVVQVDAAVQVDANLEGDGAVTDAAPEQDERFLFVETVVDGRDAAEWCGNIGARLAVIDTEADNDEVRALDNSMKWIAGGAWAGWTLGEPNGAADFCVQQRPDGLWNDIECGVLANPDDGFRTTGFVCEYLD